MTHRAVGFGRGFPRSWIFPIGALTLLLGVAASGRLSRSIVADLIAWWPIWLGIGVAAFLVRDRKFRGLRLSGLIPFVALAFIGLFTWGHLAGWPIMPSSSQRLAGPAVSGVAEAALTASIDGMIKVASGSELLYEVEPIRQGGTIGIPTASERVSGSSTEVTLVAPADPGLYAYAGWDIALSQVPTWRLNLTGAIEADLTDVDLSDASLTGSGTVILGDTLGETPLTVNGTFRLVVPTGVPARVVGVASVPATWIPDQSGAAAPISGGGWVITVVGDSAVSVGEG